MSVSPIGIREENVAAAVVALISPYTSFLYGVKLKNLKRIKTEGCWFTTVASADIGKLLQLLQGSILPGLSPRTGEEFFESRCGIFLTLKQGEEVVLLFTKKYRNCDFVDGAISLDAGTSWNALVGGHSLPAELFHWAAAVGGLAVSHPHRRDLYERYFKEENRAHPWHLKTGN